MDTASSATSTTILGSLRYQEAYPTPDSIRRRSPAGSNGLLRAQEPPPLPLSYSKRQLRVLSENMSAGDQER